MARGPYDSGGGGRQEIPPTEEPFATQANIQKLNFLIFRIKKSPSRAYAGIGGEMKGKQKKGGKLSYKICNGNRGGQVVSKDLKRPLRRKFIRGAAPREKINRRREECKDRGKSNFKYSFRKNVTPMTDLIGFITVSIMRILKENTGTRGKKKSRGAGLYQGKGASLPSIGTLI